MPWTLQITRWILAVAHVLAGAAWFGAMLYSLLVLHPRARAFFGSPRQFEDFISYVAAGARWKVLGGAAFIGVTGVGLLLCSAPGQLSPTKWAFLIVKLILFVLAITLFCFTSWVLWPARTLAATEEIPQFQQRFRLIAVALLVLIGAAMALGVVSSHL